MKTTQPPLVGRTLLAATLATAALASLPLQAIEYEAGDTKVKLDATFSAGASWRVSDQAGYNIRSSAETPISYGNSGSGNDSNLNYTRGDIFSKVVKVTPELEITHGDYGAFFRAKAFYDFKMMDGDLRYYKNSINKKGLNNDVGRAADLLDDLQRLFEGQLAQALQSVLKVFALQQLHHDEGAAGLVLVQIHHRHDVRVMQRADDARFVLEALIQLAVLS